MLKEDTLSIVGKLMDMGFTELLITEDENPVHTGIEQDKGSEYVITIVETVYHNRIQELLKMIQEFSTVRTEVSKEGFRIYEVEAKTETYL